MFESFGIAIDCSRIVEDSNIYSNELISICEKYKDVWKRESCFKVINQQLDIMGEEVKVARGKNKLSSEMMSAPLRMQTEDTSFTELEKVLEQPVY